ncbi:hypothetical protein LSAT2_000392 [Lamellibrachia satsuma]|nr:hypothetical protein LSAT2_000392 [Lamellibrachia satsuma]
MLSMHASCKHQQVSTSCKHQQVSTSYKHQQVSTSYKHQQVSTSYKHQQVMSSFHGDDNTILIAGRAPSLGRSSTISLAGNCAGAAVDLGGLGPWDGVTSKSSPTASSVALDDSDWIPRSG